MKLIAPAIIVIALAITATTAYGASTRAEYVAQVDPICATAQLQEAAAAEPLLAAKQRIRKQGKSRSNERKLNRALSFYISQHLAIERSANAQIATVPPALEDTSLVQVWLRARGELLDTEQQFFAGGLKPKGGVKAFARLFTTLFVLIGREFEVTDLVRDFSFNYCGREVSDTGGLL